MLSATERLAKEQAREEPGNGTKDDRGDSPGIVVVTVADFISKPIPVREMIVAPVVPAQGLVMVYALRGIGKTFFTLSISYAAATGGSFLRFHAPRPRKVLYLDGEMPARALQERVMSLVESFVVEPPSPDYFRIVTPDLQPLGMPDLGTVGGQSDLDHVIDDAELIVVDNISTLCRTGRENEAESWLPVQEWALRLRREGRAVVFVHHSGKGGTAQRGTSRREDVLDTVIRLSRPTDYSPTEGARFNVDLEKTRGVTGDAVAPFEARLEVVNGAAVWTMRAIENVLLIRAADLFRENYSLRDVAAELGITKSRADRLKKKARENNLLSEGTEGVPLSHSKEMGQPGHTPGNRDGTRDNDRDT